MTGKRHAPATTRNREPILAVLERLLPPTGLVLEIASGSGEHAVFFSERLPRLIWQPSNTEAEARASIDAYRNERRNDNLRPALALDASATNWPIERADAILCCNMIHIAPFSACLGLLAGAARILPTGAPLVLYGPFREGGVHTAESNARFDADLQRRNPDWGVRDLDEVLERAHDHGFDHEETVVMPAENRTVCLRRRK